LVIRQSPAVHREIEQLLQKLLELPKQYADDQPNSFRTSVVPKSMQQETELQFVDTPLVDAMGIIGELHHLKIYLAEDVKVNSGKEPVTLFVSGVTLTTALDFILEPLKLDYIIKENLIVITEAKKADEYLTQEIYQVERLGIEIDEAADLIESVVETKSWKANGGQGVIRISNHRLVISQTERNHRKIESLLQNLDRNRSRHYVRRSMFGNAGNIPGFSSI
ncbi:MAG: hypothetical protein KDA78_21545, partial [Planctomycetaceae bacterium]|nr:hypothetical protein [Planctomycetaceae bacterium]